MRSGRRAAPRHRTGSWAKPYRRRSGQGGAPGSVCPAHELSGRPPRPGTPGRARRSDGGLRPRVARPGRELPAGHAPSARILDPGLRPARATRLPGPAGWWAWAGTSRISLHCGRWRGRRVGARWWRWDTAWGATSWWAPPWPSPGPSGPSGPSATDALARVPPAAPGCRAGVGTDVGGPGRRGRAFFAHGQPRGVGPPDRGGPGGEAGGRAGPGGRPAQLPHRGPPFEVTARRPVCLRTGRRPTAEHHRRSVEWIGAKCPVRRSSRSRRRSTGRTCRIPTTSPRWSGWWWTRPGRLVGLAGRLSRSASRRTRRVATRCPERCRAVTRAAGGGAGASADGTAFRRTRRPCPRSSFP